MSIWVERGVLTASLDTGQGAIRKSKITKVPSPVTCELSKKKILKATLVAIK